MKKKIPPGYTLKGGKLLKLPQHQNGKEALKEPAGNGKRYLSAAELLAVQLMNARSILAQKNNAIIQLQAQILGLQKELGEARTTILQQQMQVELGENEKLQKEYGLPASFVFQRDEGGHFITAPAGQPPLAPHLVPPRLPVPPAVPVASPADASDDVDETELAAMIAEAEAQAIEDGKPQVEATPTAPAEAPAK
jgi:hypothetical protein